MRVLILWADNDSTNLGVRALASGAESLVNRIWPESHIDFQSFGDGAAPVWINTRSLLENSLTRNRSIVDWIASYDLVLDMRWGDSFSDIYGIRRLAAMNALSSLARRANVPVVMGPQTIGPFKSRLGRRIGLQALHTASAVITRDSTSARYSKMLGRTPDAESTDVVFAIPVFDRGQNADVAVNVSGLLWQRNPHVDYAAYQGTVVDLCTSLRDAGRRVTIFSHVLDSRDPDNDEPALADLQSQLGSEVGRFTPGSLDDVRAFCSSARIVVGSRMHACLNSLSVGTPAIPLSYSRKFEPLLGDLGWRRNIDLTAGTNHAASALAMIESSISAEEVAAVRCRADELLANAEKVLVEVAS
ncbi:polysaccharide pyruvyl transferase family protein [Rhodococcus opacus]|uniref:polysaccharide pyruvyl transferase family protein n=1 Tax=Rhodococcus opacus TaxID=37919 RepID=UPI001C44F48F|nr:polysaccharide pyruvyl transferase family protein [Rhodococcus opacus]